MVTVPTSRLANTILLGGELLFYFMDNVWTFCVWYKFVCLFFRCDPQVGSWHSRELRSDTSFPVIRVFLSPFALFCFLWYLMHVVFLSCFSFSILHCSLSLFLFQGESRFYFILSLSLILGLQHLTRSQLARIRWKNCSCVRSGFLPRVKGRLRYMWIVFTDFVYRLSFVLNINETIC